MSTSRRSSHPSAPHAVRLVVLALALLALAASATAQPYARGFNPPADWQEQLEARRYEVPMDKDPLPSNFDWRALDGVTPAKNQGDCGSCWAFAAVGEMEAKIKIYYGKTLNLSEQQIVSCNPYGAGCNGGWAGAAYYIFMHYGSVLENCMPYEGSDHVACVQDEYLKFSDMESWRSIANNVDQIKTEVMNNGPVCTSVDANDAWDGYSGGIIDVPGNGTNHLVLIVGWDDRMGDDGVWIVKNSWGASWGEAGYCYVAYDACNIGAGVTSMTYNRPAADVTVASPADDELVFGDGEIEIEWVTYDQTVDAVDIYFGTVGTCQDMVVAENVPNTGSYTWQVPNLTTERGSLVVFPSEGTYRGFGFTEGEFHVIGHQTRYVSDDGSNTPPYDTPGKAAHTIAAAVLEGAGRDTIMIAGGDYLESGISVNSQAHLMGGWSPDFTVHDPQTYTTRLRGVSGTIGFDSSAMDYCGVSHITFHDCQGWNLATPVNGRHGAAIISLGASPVIEHCIFENNRAEPGTGPGWGGAILTHGGSPVIRDCEFRGNVGSHGGAIAISAAVDAMIDDCLFMANATSDSSASYAGAAIYVAGGSATVRDSELRGGGSGVGGGVAVAAAADVTLENVAIVANRAVTAGAGVHVSQGALTVQRGEIADNAVWMGSGGGLYLDGATVDVRNVEIAGNAASSLGGGVYGQSVGGAMRHALIRDNTASTGGGLFVSSQTDFAMTDNVVVGNTGGGVLATGGAITSDYNLAHGNTGGDFLMAPGPHDMVADPQFVDTAGGDYAPALHSPLVDSGSGLGGVDWDGGTADRGHYGGTHGMAVGPAHVDGLAGSFVDGLVSLTWDAVDGAATYTVYRDSAAVFVPSAAVVCGSLDGGTLTCQDTPPAGDWYYLVAACDADGHMGGYSEPFFTSGGQGTPVGDLIAPAELAVTGLAPNPFNPRTVVRFDVPRAAVVRLQVFDLRGRLVATLQDGPLAAGSHEATWMGTDRSGRSAATGVYLVRLDDGRSISTRKAVLAK